MTILALCEKIADISPKLLLVLDLCVRNVWALKKLITVFCNYMWYSRKEINIKNLYSNFMVHILLLYI